MNDNTVFKVLGTISAVSLIYSIVAAILYLMALPIFDQADLAWMFVYGLAAAGISLGAFIVRAIWNN